MVAGVAVCAGELTVHLSHSGAGKGAGACVPLARYWGHLRVKDWICGLWMREAGGATPSLAEKAAQARSWGGSFRRGPASWLGSVRGAVCRDPEASLRGTLYGEEKGAFEGTRQT